VLSTDIPANMTSTSRSPSILAAGRQAADEVRYSSSKPHSSSSFINV